jgi:hypothetical protein
MRLLVDASRFGVRHPDACAEAGRAAIGFLEQIAMAWPMLGFSLGEVPKPQEPHVVCAMWEAADRVGAPDLTPMAAVAGAIADATAAYLVQMGMTRVVVNNGGDISFSVPRSDVLRVGVRPDLRSPRVTHRLSLRGSESVHGVATSGLGGRSMTRGIASSCTVIARNAAIADAAATAVANASWVEDVPVRRARANELDPTSDLATREVTVAVGALSAVQSGTALKQAIAEAERLEEKGIISGACVFVHGAMAMTESLETLMEPLPLHPNDMDQ